MLGLYFLSYALTGKPVLSLYPDRIEVSWLLSTRQLHQYEVSGYRIINHGWSFYEIILEPNSSLVKPVKISSILKRDDILDEWLDRFPDLDRLEADEVIAELAEDPELGADPEERLSRIDFARRVAFWLNIFVLAIVLWVLFYPRPYVVAVTVATVLPWIAIVLVGVWPHLYRLDAKNEHGRPLLMAQFLLPGIALALRGFLDYELLDWRLPVAIGAFSGLVFAVIAAIADRRTPLTTGAVALLLLLTFPYGYGATMVLNGILDRGTPQFFPTRVQGKFVSGGEHTTYTVKLDAWGHWEEPYTLNVPREVFDQIGTRMAVCVRVNPGAFRIPYMTLDACPPGSSGPQTGSELKTGPVAIGLSAYHSGDYEQALKVLRQPTAAGNATAQFTLGLLYWDGLGIAKDGTEAMRLFYLAAAQGHARAMNVIGFSYEHGRGVSPDIKEAVYWYRKAVELEEPRALNNLGILYDKGYGVPRDLSEARRLWREALEQGHAPAMHNLGIMYLEGEGIPRDPNEARRLWLEAAKQGHAPTLNSLGIMHYHSQGVPRDLDEAKRFWRMAADRGHVQAQTSLGTMYYQGEGVARDSVEAGKLWRSAAGQGHAPAMLNLALLYHNGDGVERDYVQAHMWLALAALRYAPGKEQERAIANLKDLALRMTPEEINKAKKTARLLIQKNNWQ